MSTGHRQEASRHSLDCELLGCTGTLERIQSTLGLLPCSSGANNKRCRAASNIQVTASMCDRNGDCAAAQQVPQHSMYHAARPTGNNKKARSSAAPVHNRLSEYHPASAPADPAVLESFRPFLQQLAAGIVAGFSAARPKGTSQVTGGGDGIAASILQTTAAAPAATPSDSYSSWQPSELSAQHMIDHLMLMGEQRGSCGAWPPGSSDLPMRDAVDAVAVVSRRTRGREQRAGGKRAAQKCTVLRGTTEHRTTAAAATGEVRTVHKQKDQYKAGSCRTSSNVIPQLDPAPPTAAGAMEAEEPMTPPTADITAVSRLAAAAPDSTAAADTTSSADMNAYAQESYLHQEPLGRYLVPLVLISSCQRAQPEQRKVSYSLGSWPTGADAANHLAGNSAIQVAAIAPAAAATAAVASTSTKPLTSCRASTSMGTSPELKRGAAASADSNSDSLMTNAAARRINSIRQHVALLEATLGKQSTQVASAYLFLADVLQSDGDQNTLDAESALGTALEIITSTAAK